MKKKVGRPKKMVNEKKVVWAFTIEKSKKDAALRAADKKNYDEAFRKEIEFQITNSD